jgi:hypothetical protein
MSLKDFPPVTQEQEAALRRYARINGRYWKACLRSQWTIGGPGRDSTHSLARYDLLQQLRNSHGPMWLRLYKIPVVADPETLAAVKRTEENGRPETPHECDGPECCVENPEETLYRQRELTSQHADEDAEQSYRYRSL